MENLILELGPEILGLHPTGSYYICSPPVLNTDIDYLILCENLKKFQEILINKSYIECFQEEGNYYCEEGCGISWNAWRKDRINLIITEDINWYQASIIATEYCKAFNIQDKNQRVRIFRFLKYREPLLEGDIT